MNVSSIGRSLTGKYVSSDFRRLAISLMCLVPALNACQAQKTSDFELALEASSKSSELSEFQWALMSQGSLLLYQRDSQLLPASAAGSGVLESIPLKIQIQRYSDNQTITVPLATVLSPYQVTPREWQLEFQRDGKWLIASSYQFKEGRFVVDIAGTTETLYELKFIRFTKR